MTTNEQAEALARECAHQLLTASSIYVNEDAKTILKHIPLAELLVVAEAAGKLSDARSDMILRHQVEIELKPALTALRAKLPKGAI